MHFLLSKFKSQGLNERAWSVEDVRRICRKEKITLIEIPMTIPGWFCLFKGKSYIYLDTRLRGLRWLHVLLHEMAHHFLHTHGMSNAAYFFGHQQNSKEHFEAEAFAILAMIPIPELERLLKEDLSCEDVYLQKLLAFRLKVLDLYGI